MMIENSYVIVVPCPFIHYTNMIIILLWHRSILFYCVDFLGFGSVGIKEWEQEE